VCVRARARARLKYAIFERWKKSLVGRNF